MLISSVRCVTFFVFLLFLLISLGECRQGDSMSSNLHVPGDIIDGRYRLMSLLGDGGCAYVWLVWNLRIRQHQALKILKFSTSNPMRRRFRTEALAAGELSNSPDWRSKFIIRVSDVSDDDAPEPWMALPYLPGGDLWEYLGHSQPSAHTGLQIVLDIAYGLQLAHSRTVRGELSPIIHRDLKPQNILLGQHNQIIITDFGIAGVLHEMNDDGENMPGATTVGAKMGTLGWSAPEQLMDASKKDVRGDIFSLGVILAALIADFDPGVGENTKMLHLESVRNEHLQRVPKSIRLIITTACNVDPDLRYPSVDVMIDAIQEAMPEFPPTALPWVVRDGHTLPVRPVPVAPSNTPLPQGTLIPDVKPESPQTVHPMEMTTVEEEAPPAPKPRNFLALGLLGIGMIATVSLGIHFWPHRQEATPVVETPVEVPAETHAEPVSVPPIEPPPKPVVVPVPVEVKPKVETKPSVAQGVTADSSVEALAKTNRPSKAIAQPSVTLLHLPSSVHPGETVTVSAKFAIPKNQSVASVTLRYQGSTGGAWQHTTMTINDTTAKASLTASPSLGTSMILKVDMRLTSDPGTPVKSDEATVAISTN